MTYPTVTALVHQILTTAGLSALNTTRDQALTRDNSAMPYGTVREGISRARATSGRHASRRNDLIQVDLDQTVGSEDPELPSKVWAALEAAPPAQVGTDRVFTVYRLQPTGGNRRLDPTRGVVTDSLTVAVVRSA